MALRARGLLPVQNLQQAERKHLPCRPADISSGPRDGVKQKPFVHILGLLESFPGTRANKWRKRPVFRPCCSQVWPDPHPSFCSPISVQVSLAVSAREPVLAGLPESSDPLCKLATSENSNGESEGRTS